MPPMAKTTNGRRGPSTPMLKLSLHSATDPTSPPDTPTVQAPASLPLYRYSRALALDPNIKPVGNGHQFSYRPAHVPGQLSPRSWSTSSSSSLSSSSAVDPRSLTQGSPAAVPSVGGQLEADDDSGFLAESSDQGSDTDEPVEDEPAHALGAGEFVIEDIDAMDSGCEGLDVLHPTEIESMPSRPRSRHRDLDRVMMHDLEKLHCSNEGCDKDEDEEVFLQRRQELRRHRRLSMSSSFGKRSHSELSDSDQDDGGSVDVNDVGSSARRMRKRLHRGSLLFQDPPEPRIDELEEPDSNEDECATEKSLARELPYYAMDMMEMDRS